MLMYSLQLINKVQILCKNVLPCRSYALYPVEFFVATLDASNAR